LIVTLLFSGIMYGSI